MHLFSSTRHPYVDLEAVQDGVAVEVRRANGRKQQACCINLRVRLLGPGSNASGTKARQ